MKPLRVIAHLQNSFSQSDPWSPALDGILAYWALRNEMGDDFFTSNPATETIQPDLPLERVTHDDRWWWACSSPQCDVATRHTRYEHRRFDFPQAIDHLHENTKNILVVGGPYKNSRGRRMLTVTDSVQWHVIGEADGIRDLLSRCTAIGGGRGGGSGVVLRWEITEDGADEHAARFRRPLPVACAAENGVTGAPMEWGIVPPGRLNRVLCVMPI